MTCSVIYDDKGLIFTVLLQFQVISICSGSQKKQNMHCYPCNI